MPHVGGGSSSGGFHYGGSSSSSNGNVQRFDAYGNLHSKHYKKPGFYYGGCYVAYSRCNRTINSLMNGIIMILVSFFIFGVAIFVYFSDNGRQTSKLEEYSLNKYSEIYENNDSYEYNILIDIVLYESETEIDYMPIVGDYIDRSVDEFFGNDNTLFGRKLITYLDSSDNKVLDIYSTLSKALDDVTKEIEFKHYKNNTQQSKIINDTDFELANYDMLKNSAMNFYNTTGYQISFVMSKYDVVYKNSYVPVIIISAVAVLILGFSIFGIIKQYKAVKFITKEEKNGNGKKYFEGEVEFEKYLKDHPIDEKFKYNPKEYLNKEDIEKEKIDE